MAIHTKRKLSGGRAQPTLAFIVYDYLSLRTLDTFRQVGMFFSIQAT